MSYINNTINILNIQITDMDKNMVNLPHGESPLYGNEMRIYGAESFPPSVKPFVKKGRTLVGKKGFNKPEQQLKY